MTAAFSILDEGADRRDLAERSERKFVFAPGDVPSIRRALERSCRRIQYGPTPVSHVSSIYFDDPELTTCRASLVGVGERHKTRVRWYDAAAPSSSLYFERKWRRYELTGKRRFALSGASDPSAWSYRDLHAALRGALPVQYDSGLARERDAVVLVEYAREHFVSLDGTARLTIDSDLRFYPQRGRRAFSRRFPLRFSDVVIVECKAAPGASLELRGLLGALNVRRSRFSKYATACQVLGYV